MASQRQLDLAQYLAEGMDGVEAMLKAGWPESTASWLGKDAVGYLAKGGIDVVKPGKPAAAPKPAQPSDAGGDEPTGEPAPVIAEGAPIETTEPAPVKRGRSTKERAT